MSGPTIGELFAGYGGIGLGVKEVWPDAQIAWVSDVCKFAKDGTAGHHEPHRAPCSILAHHHPDAPNLGDITKVDWSTVPRVDIITGGSPCQDLSHAGKRAGMKAGTRSGLWASMCDAIETLRPSLVIWENVRGALSADAITGDVESCGFCMADRDGQPMRALGRVLGDLADVGYDAAWVGLRAADVGACHGRFRVFVLAWPADAPSVGLEWSRASRLGFAGLADGGSGVVGLPTPQAHDARGGKTPEQVAAMRAKGYGVANLNEGVVNDLMPSPRASDGAHGGPNQRGSSGDLMLSSAVAQLLPTTTAKDAAASGGAEGSSNITLTDAMVRGRTLPTPRATRGGSSTGTTALLPTPAVNDMGAAYTPETWDDWTDAMKSKHGNGNGHGKSLNIEAQRLAMLPTPQTSDANGAGDKPGEWADRWQLRDVELAKVQAIFGNYAPAIARQAAAFGRPAPSPTEPTGKNGANRLSPRFAEWMMALPDGWVTDVPGVSRTEALKALGNGVVPPQAAEAIRWLLEVRARTLGVAA